MKPPAAAAPNQVRSRRRSAPRDPFGGVSPRDHSKRALELFAGDGAAVDRRLRFVNFTSAGSW